MTTEQIHDAIQQMRTHCELLQASYEAVSARGALYTLGFNGDDADAVLAHIYAGGFTYCLDPQYSATHFDPNNPKAVNGMITDYPSADACYWGPDQLKSRLDSLSNTPRSWERAS